MIWLKTTVRNIWIETIIAAMPWLPAIPWNVTRLWQLKHNLFFLVLSKTDSISLTFLISDEQSCETWLVLLHVLLLEFWLSECNKLIFVSSTSDWWEVKFKFGTSAFFARLTASSIFSKIFIHQIVMRSSSSRMFRWMLILFISRTMFVLTIRIIRIFWQLLICAENETLLVFTSVADDFKLDFA